MVPSKKLIFTLHGHCFSVPNRVVSIINQNKKTVLLKRFFLRKRGILKQNPTKKEIYWHAWYLATEFVIDIEHRKHLFNLCDPKLKHS